MMAVAVSAWSGYAKREPQVVVKIRGVRAFLCVCFL